MGPTALLGYLGLGTKNVAGGGSSRSSCSNLADGLSLASCDRKECVEVVSGGKVLAYNN
jgi:hypothetical protein